MLLVGSKALNHWMCGGNDRKPRDTDYICTHNEAKHYISVHMPDRVEHNAKGTTLVCHKNGELPTELMIAWEGSTNDKILGLEEMSRGGFAGNIVASLNILYLMKMSHRYLKNSPHFKKTMSDIHLMRGLGATIDQPALLKARELETYDYKHPSLMRNKKAFFNPNEGVGYKYDHDTIHIAMAIEPLRPAYTHFKHDQAEVMIDKHKWNAASLHIQLHSVLEESYVLALERSQIPYRDKVDPRRSFEIALEKVCTSISSGWWREFAWEHYDDVMRLFNEREAIKPYLMIFDEAVEAVIVKPFEGSHPMEQFA